MSLKRMAASTPRRSTGWRVTSAARSGVLHSSRNPTFDRMARYSGRYLPAWRMNQMGVQSGSSRLHARRYRSARDMEPSIASASRPARHLLQFQHRLPLLEDADGARGLGNGNGDGPRLHRDGGGSRMPGAETERKVDVVPISAVP